MDNPREAGDAVERTAAEITSRGACCDTCKPGNPDVALEFGTPARRPVQSPYAAAAIATGKEVQDEEAGKITQSAEPSSEEWDQQWAQADVPGRIAMSVVAALMLCCVVGITYLVLFLLLVYLEDSLNPVLQTLLGRGSPRCELPDYSVLYEH